MDKKFVESFAFFGKIGADNALLILIGVEHIILFALKYSEGRHYKRLWLYLNEGAFFIGYGLFNDVYRVKFVRPWLLSWSYNFAYVNSFAILIFGIPLLIRISLDIQNIIIERRKTKYVYKYKHDTKD